MDLDAFQPPKKKEGSLVGLHMFKSCKTIQDKAISQEYQRKGWGNLTASVYRSRSLMGDEAPCSRGLGACWTKCITPALQRALICHRSLCCKTAVARALCPAGARWGATHTHCVGESWECDNQLESDPPPPPPVQFSHAHNSNIFLISFNF